MAGRAHHLISPYVPPVLQDVWDFLDVADWAPRMTKEHHETLLMSSELIAHTPPDMVQRYCKEILQWFDLHVVIYLRRQDNLIMAGYNQQIKAGGRTQDIRAKLEAPIERFDYEKKLAPWAASVGTENLTVRPYEYGQLYRADIRRDFMAKVLGLGDADDFEYPVGNPNPRLSCDSLEYKRLINCVNPERTLSSAIGRALLDISQSAGDSSIEVVGAKALLSSAERLAILARYESSNAAVARRYLGRAAGVLFSESLPDSFQGDHAIEVGAEQLREISRCIMEQHPKLYVELRTVVESALTADDQRVADAAQSLLESFQRYGKGK